MHQNYNLLDNYSNNYSIGYDNCNTSSELQVWHSLLCFFQYFHICVLEQVGHIHYVVNSNSEWFYFHHSSDMKNKRWQKSRKIRVENTSLTLKIQKIKIKKVRRISLWQQLTLVCLRYSLLMYRKIICLNKYSHCEVD